jgi:ubiquinone/menaquinone biosynthesis C-methylase UbiE
MNIPIKVKHELEFGFPLLPVPHFDNRQYNDPQKETHMDEYYAANLETWNKWTELHKDSDSYDLPGFLKGDLRLHALEQEELGEVKGKTLLHLQCHFGLDTLSWARLGAQVTGVDFSDRAIDLARKVAQEAGLEARFICSNLFDLPAVLDEQFDVVFTSYGALYWLHDLPAWGRLVKRYLKPGGVFYVAEFHPFSQIFEESEDQKGVRVTTRYFPDPQPLKYEVTGSYAAPEAQASHSIEYGWTHTLSDILNALISAGLALEFVHEFPYTVDPSFYPNLVEPLEGGYWRLKVHAESIPLMFSIRAHRPRNDV